MTDARASKTSAAVLTRPTPDLLSSKVSVAVLVKIGGAVAVPTFTWWDGSALQGVVTASSGWWDGSVIQTIDWSLSGYWNGSAIQPLA